jgi:hypothetical protein
MTHSPREWLLGRLATFRAWLTRRSHVAEWRRRGRKLFVCHLAHENDRVAARIAAEYLTWAGVDSRILEFNESGQRPELQASLRDDTIAILGFNSQLDHSWIGEENFITAADKMNIPVIQLILDHPSSRWPAFTNNPHAPNVSYLFVSRFCEDYFRRYALPEGRTGVISAGFNPAARVDGVSRAAFLKRETACLIPLNLRRLGGTREELQAQLDSLAPEVREVVRTALERARCDLVNPLVLHLEQALAQRGMEIPNSLMHVCAGLVEDMTQVWRRRHIFAVAARYPVVIQTDIPPSDLPEDAVAVFRTTPEWTNPKRTLARFKVSRAVLSVSLTNDAWHDRACSAINAGCVAIVEDNVAYRQLLRPGKSALFFRYDDDSLARCLDLVCNDPLGAYDIARVGMKLRDKPSIRYSGCHNILDLAIATRPPEQPPNQPLKTINP